MITPRVTIVIPVYNRLHFLGATIESVLAQTMTDWELIVVDDGSTEDVAGFITRYPDPRISYVRQENQGNALARNLGIRKTTGEYVVCLDSDDVLVEDMLATCVAELSRRPEVDVIYTQVNRIDAEGVALSVPITPEPRNGNLLEPLLMGIPILPSSAVARRSCFERWGYYTPGLDDWELWLRWAAKGCLFYCVERPLLFYRIHDRNFHLDVAKRREIHFKMLDAFYEQTELPDIAIALRRKAYISQFLNFAILARDLGEMERAGSELALAINFAPELLEDPEFYGIIASSQSGRTVPVTGDKTEPKSQEPIEAKALPLLEALFSSNDLPQAIRCQEAKIRAQAYLVLGRLAYPILPAAETRRLLAKSLAYWPAVAWRTDWPSWLLRSLVGYRSVQFLKQAIRTSPLGNSSS